MKSTAMKPAAFRLEDVVPAVYRIVIKVEGLGEKTLSAVPVSGNFINDLGAIVWI